MSQENRPWETCQLRLRSACNLTILIARGIYKAYATYAAWNKDYMVVQAHLSIGALCMSQWPFFHGRFHAGFSNMGSIRIGWKYIVKFLPILLHASHSHLKISTSISTCFLTIDIKRVSHCDFFVAQLSCYLRRTPKQDICKESRPRSDPYHSFW